MTTQSFRGIRRRAWAVAILVAAFWGTASSIGAWGAQGHRVVAQIATNHLSPQAKLLVSSLLGDETLADVSSWADRYLEGNYQTSYWHYVNIPPDAAAYDRDRDCPRQPGVSAGSTNDKWRDCVVDRIVYNQQRLADVTLDRADRAVALKFLVHFVGDLHQPFHALGVERGGNGVLVTVFGSPQCGAPGTTPYNCNLHGTWDSGLIAHRQMDDAQLVARLEQQIAERRLNERARGSSVEWAMESRDLAKLALVPQQGIIDEAYFRTHWPVIEQQLALAGLRLADLINSSAVPSPSGQR